EVGDRRHRKHNPVGALGGQPLGSLRVDLADRMPQRQFDTAYVASGGPSLVAHQRQQVCQLRAGHPQRLEAVTQPPGPSRSSLTVATDVHWKMLTSNGFRATDHVVE